MNGNINFPYIVYWGLKSYANNFYFSSNLNIPSDTCITHSGMQRYNKNKIIAKKVKKYLKNYDFLMII